MITITDGTTQVQLSDAFEWVDEFAWSSVEQDIKRPIGGALIINETAITGGRPITLQSGDNVWTDRSVVVQLHTWANTAGIALTLTFSDTTSFDVAFRAEDGSIEAKPVMRRNTGSYLATDKYTLTLRLMEI